MSRNTKVPLHPLLPATAKAPTKFFWHCESTEAPGKKKKAGESKSFMVIQKDIPLMDGKKWGSGRQKRTAVS